MEGFIANIWFSVTNMIMSKIAIPFISLFVIGFFFKFIWKHPQVIADGVNKTVDFTFTAGKKFIEMSTSTYKNLHESLYGVNFENKFHDIAFLKFKKSVVS